jgi:hypothetical protein
MVKRWMASALLATEKNFRKNPHYWDLWALDAILNGSKMDQSLVLDGSSGVVRWHRPLLLTFNGPRATFLGQAPRSTGRIVTNSREAGYVGLA